jgi:tryptophan synthase alpha chain
MRKYNGFYLMCSYPDRDTFINAAVKGLEHFDFLEIGVPFSDPIADGPVIAEAAHSVLSAGFTFDHLAGCLREIRSRAGSDKDIYLMTYSNIIFNRKGEELNSLIQEYGIRGFIIPDIPFSEKDFFEKLNPPVNASPVSFITPESSSESIRSIAAEKSPFIYFISKRGITGGEFSIDPETATKLKQARELSSSPVVLGFGIRDSASALEALKHADGFIMGTALVNILKTGSLDEYSIFIDKLFEGINTITS